LSNMLASSEDLNSSKVMFLYRVLRFYNDLLEKTTISTCKNYATDYFVA